MIGFLSGSDAVRVHVNKAVAFLDMQLRNASNLNEVASQAGHSEHRKKNSYTKAEAER